MTRRTIAVLVATAVVALGSGAAAPHARAISFVDKQVQAGGLLIQNYIDKYGVANQFHYPAKTMVKKGGGLPDATLMWPANPWTGRTMGPGTARGSYTYTLGAGGTSYKLVMHFSSGSYTFRGALPRWLKNQRDTASKQNLLLLQRYLDAYATGNGGKYPSADLVTSTTFSDPAYVWPVSPWTGNAMAQGNTLGDFSYAQLSGGDGYALKVMLVSGWSSTLGPLSVLSRLTATPGG